MELTKKALSQGLKELMQTVEFDKITVAQVTKQAEMSRNTFYYHFADMNELLEWTYDHEIVHGLESFQDLKTWKEGLLRVLEYTEQNRKFCLNTFHSLSRDRLEMFLYKITYHMLIDMMQKNYDFTILNQNLREQIADFYGRAIVAQVIHWLLTRLEESKEEVIARIERVTTGTIDLIIQQQK